MAKLSFPRTAFTGQPNVDVAAKGSQQLSKSLQGVPFLNGNWAVDAAGSEAISLSAGFPVALTHRLGRAAQGFFPVLRQPSTTYVSLAMLAPTTEFPIDKFVIVLAEHTCVTSVWVF